VNITRPCAQSPVAGSETWSRGYGAEDRRHRAEQGGVGRTFAYGVWNSVAGLTQVSGFPFQVFPSVVWGLDLSGSLHGAGGVGGLLMWLQPQSVGWSGDLELRPHWYTYDGNGNVSDLVSGEWDFTNFLDPTFSSALENHYEYGAFGEIVAATENRPENPFRFSTKWHEGNGLVYYGYRYYVPETGRWPNRDPIGEEGGLNLYGMVGNDAVDHIDHLGLALVGATEDPPQATNRVQQPGNFQKLIDEFKKQQGSCCLAQITIDAHANPDGFVLADGIGQSGGPAANTGTNPAAANAVNATNATSLFRQLKSQVKLCKPCTIIFLSCNLGLGPVPGIVAGETGCKVHAPNGYCYPNHKKPLKSKIKPTVPGLPTYPGATNKFQTF